MSDTRDTGKALLEAVLNYVDRGLAVTWIGYGEKAPKHDAWNTLERVITTPEGARVRFGNGALFNIGLVHSLGTVKTCSFDVDEPEHTRAIFEELGLNFDAILESDAPCVRGKPGRVRFEYRQPPGMDLPARKLNWPAKAGGAGKFTVFELRAGPSQDVLPPSKHPDGQLYEWITPLPESNDAWPTPPAALLEIWQNWEAWEPLMQELCPWRKPAAPKPTPRPRGVKGLVDVIGQFNQAHSIRDVLEKHGYKPKGARRWLPPNSTSGIPSVRLLPGNDTLVFSSNGSCPLNNDRVHDAFDCYRILAHGGDWKAAREIAAELLGIDLRPPRDSSTSSSNSTEPPDREPPPADAYADDPEAQGQTRDKGAGSERQRSDRREEGSKV